MHSTPHSVGDLQRLARRRLPRMVSDFLEGGALDETSLARNRSALAEISFTQRVLVDVALRSTETELFENALDLPLIVSPMGLLTVLHPEADVAIARAAAAAGSIFIHSPWSGCSVEEVAAAAPGRVWSQIAFWRDDEQTRRHVDAARAMEIDTLVVAGDVGLSSKRDRDLRHGTGVPPHPPLRDLLDIARHPRWLLRLATGRKLTYGSYVVDGRPMRAREMASWMAVNENPAATWEHVARLRRQWPGRVVVKGVMSVADARRAIEVGADGVFVSNHGGRQFDDQPATAEVLPEIADAVSGRAAVIFDGGVRRGADVAKAIALGADAVAAGRPFAFGLAAGGEAGARSAFEILAGELRTVMGFVGARTVRDLTGETLARRPPSTADLGAPEGATTR